MKHFIIKKEHYLANYVFAEERKDSLKYLSKVFILLLTLFTFNCLYADPIFVELNTNKTKENVSVNDSITGLLTKHVIIAFDDFVLKQFSNYLLEGSIIKSKLRIAMSDLGLRHGDYYSLVNFSISAYNDDINELVRPIKDSKGNELVWRPFKSIEDVLSQNEWTNMIVSQGRDYVGRGAFSLLTGAKAYALTTVPSKDGKMVNRTYLLMVTDDNYNGNDDYNKEFSTLWYENPNCRLSKTAFTGHCKNVNLFYKFLYNKKYNIASSGERSYDVHVYDVNPQSYVALPSVVNYPANLGLRQINDGYQLNFECSTVSQDYIIKKMQVIYIDNKNQEHKTEFANDTTVIINIPNSDIGTQDSLKVFLRGWIQQNDKLYGGLLLSPDDSLSQRLNVSIKLELKNEARLFGIIPIPSLLWSFTDNTNVAVTVWSVISILLLILFMWWLVRKLIFDNTTYHPNNKQIKIKRIK